MLLESDALLDFVGCSVDMVKSVAPYNGVNVLLFALTQTVDWPIGLVDYLGLTVRDVPGSDCAIVGSADEEVAIDIHVADSFCVAEELIEDVAFFGAVPVDYRAILETAK